MKNSARLLKPPFLLYRHGLLYKRGNLGNILNQHTNKLICFVAVKKQKKTSLIILETLRPKTFDWVCSLFHKSFQDNLLRGIANCLGVWYRACWNTQIKSWIPVLETYWSIITSMAFQIIMDQYQYSIKILNYFPV